MGLWRVYEITGRYSEHCGVGWQIPAIKKKVIFALCEQFIYLTATFNDR